MKEIKFGHQLYYTHSYDFFRKKVIAASKENWDASRIISEEIIPLFKNFNI